MILFWVLVFAVSLYVLIIGSGWFLKGAQNIGIALGMSPFAVGVLIVGIGTSLPEVASALAAVFQNAQNVVVATAVGSNIANILLVLGLSSIIAKKISVTKNLIDVEIPVLIGVTGIFVFMAYDGGISTFESVLLILLLILQVIYIVRHDDNKVFNEGIDRKIDRAKGIFKYFLFLVVGGIAIFLGARYFIVSFLEIVKVIQVPVEVATITVLALGTSLPEIVVSITAALKGDGEVAVGNIFGSNVFNLVLVVGLPGLITFLPVDQKYSRNWYTCINICNINSRIFWNI